MENLDIIIGTLIGSGLTTLVAVFVTRVSNRFKQVNNDLQEVNQDKDSRIDEVIMQTARDFDSLQRDIDSQLNKLEHRLTQKLK